METSVLAVDARKIGKIDISSQPDDVLDELNVELDPQSRDAQFLRLAAERLRSSDVPIAFPTETVYGLGADATRSNAVLGIYKAKQRPADNPLIVHFASLRQLRRLLGESTGGESTLQMNGDGGGGAAAAANDDDPIPSIYRPLIARFWPGPLTIILPNPRMSPLAPEVTAGLSTFGARIPKHVLALALIKSAGVPVAAPSANASGKPSPTAAEHVAYDLDGRIEVILDGGPCDVGVESTVVDGLSHPPLILRPGGISIEQLRSCPGWEETQIGYKNVSELGSQPKAPGMKYRHYSPRAAVVLCEAGKEPPAFAEMETRSGEGGKVGIVTTKTWIVNANATSELVSKEVQAGSRGESLVQGSEGTGFVAMLESFSSFHDSRARMKTHAVTRHSRLSTMFEIPLGTDTANIARGIFSALRELDRANVETIFVEGIDDAEGDLAAAIMNRLRKAAEIKAVA